METHASVWHVTPSPCSVHILFKSRIDATVTESIQHILNVRVPAFRSQILLSLFFLLHGTSTVDQVDLCENKEEIESCVVWRSDRIMLWHQTYKPSVAANQTSSDQIFCATGSNKLQSVLGHDLTGQHRHKRWEACSSSWLIAGQKVSMSTGWMPSNPAAFHTDCTMIN